MSVTALYRHFDADGRLLYVGVAADPARRHVNHLGASKWITQVTRIDIEWLPSRGEALIAEAMAIRTERPENNFKKLQADMSATGYIGVRRASKGNRWRATMTINGVTRQIGSFRCPTAAAFAYDRKAIELRGAAATTNFKAGARPK